MSGAIKINGTSSGSTTITAPASGGDESIELSTALAAKLDASAQTVLQVVHVDYSTEMTTTSGSAVDTGLSATITPTKSTSTILVILNLRYLGQDTSLIRGQLVRDSTVVHGPVRICNSAALGGWSVAYSDSPATTSATTYKVQVYKDIAGGTAFVAQQAGQQISTITLMEVSA